MADLAVPGMSHGLRVQKVVAVWYSICVCVKKLFQKIIPQSCDSVIDNLSKMLWLNLLKPLLLRRYAVATQKQFRVSVKAVWSDKHAENIQGSRTSSDPVAARGAEGIRCGAVAPGGHLAGAFEHLTV